MKYQFMFTTSLTIPHFRKKSFPIKVRLSLADSEAKNIVLMERGPDVVVDLLLYGQPSTSTNDLKINKIKKLVI